MAEKVTVAILIVTVLPTLMSIRVLLAACCVYTVL